MTPSQCRAARGLIRWSQDQLAEAASVSALTIRNFEKENSTPQRASLEVIRRALEAAGVIFVAENGEGPGVRMRKQAKDDAGIKPTGPASDDVGMMDAAIEGHRAERTKK